MKCTICHHPRRHDLDRDLLAGNDTFSALKQKYGPSVSALWRHKKHLQEKMRRAEARLQNNLRQGSLFQFNAFLETARQLVRTATEAGNPRHALQAISAGTRILNFITKLDVKLDDDTVYRVLASPQWTTQDSLLPNCPEIITDSHQALADDLFFPCPAPPPGEADEDDADAEAEDDRDELEEIPPFWESPKPRAAVPNILPLKNSPAPDPLQTSPPEIAICCFPLPVNRSAALETRLPPGTSRELLQQILPQLDQRQVSQLGTENRPKYRREKSAKLPKKSPQFEQINERYQSNIWYEKNLAKNSCVGRESDAPPLVDHDCVQLVEPGALENDPRQTSFAPATKTRQPATVSTKLETLPLGITPELLQQILPRLDQLQPEPQKIEEIPPKNQREITEKNTFFKPIWQSISGTYTMIKNVAKNLRAGRERAVPPAVNHSCFPPAESHTAKRYTAN